MGSISQQNCTKPKLSILIAMSFQRTVWLAALLAEVPAFLHSASVIITARLTEAEALRSSGTKLSEAELSSLEEEYFSGVRQELKQIKEHASYLLAQLGELHTPEILKKTKAAAISTLQELSQKADSLSSFPAIAGKPDSHDKAPEPSA